MKKLVIFDLDGTLLDTIADLAQCTNHALAECGFPAHAEEEYRFMVGNGINKLFERALPDGHKTEENIARIREVFVPYYSEHGTDMTRPYDGITAMLAALQSMGVKLAVASNKIDSATKKLVPHYFPEIAFTAVCGNREGVAPKPDPAIAEGILAATGIDRHDALFVGDTCVDMETAINAGIEAVGVTWGFRPRAELERLSPAHIADTPAEILGMV